MLNSLAFLSHLNSTCGFDSQCFQYAKTLQNIIDEILNWSSFIELKIIQGKSEAEAIMDHFVTKEKLMEFLPMLNKLVIALYFMTKTMLKLSNLQRAKSTSF